MSGIVHAVGLGDAITKGERPDLFDHGGVNNQAKACLTGRAKVLAGLRIDLLGTRRDEDTDQPLAVEVPDDLLADPADGRRVEAMHRGLSDLVKSHRDDLDVLARRDVSVDRPSDVDLERHEVIDRREVGMLGAVGQHKRRHLVSGAIGGQAGRIGLSAVCGTCQTDGPHECEHSQQAYGASGRDPPSKSLPRNRVPSPGWTDAHACFLQVHWQL